MLHAWSRWAATLVFALFLEACAVAPLPPGPTATPVVAAATLAPPAQTPTRPAVVDPAPASLTATPTLPGSTDTPSPLPPTPGPTGTLGATSRGRMENFELLGHDTLDGRGWNAGLALAYPCAYVGNRRLPSIAIVDVSDPARPLPAGTISLAPGLEPVELRAVPELGLLVVLNFSAGVSLMTYDVNDCRQPRPLATVALGAAPHEFYLWRDPARPGRLLAFVAMWAHQKPDLQVIDLTDPASPQRLGQWQADTGAGTLHSISLSPDGRTAYLSMWEGGLLLADASDYALGRPAPSLRVLNPRDALLPPPRVDVHSAVPLADAHYVLLTQEYYSCPFGGLSVVDVRDPARPVLAGRFDLPENAGQCASLPAADAVFTAHNPLVVGPLAFVSWYAGGLQAFDLSDPRAPVRTGLFVPDGLGPLGGSPYGGYPVQVWSYPILRAGVIYVSDIRGGLFVLRYTGRGAAAVNAVGLAQGNANTLP